MLDRFLCWYSVHGRFGQLLALKLHAKLYPVPREKLGYFS